MKLERYKRQLIIDGWGEEAQERLRRARVLVVGAGGLGCPAALSLALAGVGHIRICDGDTVEMSNLNRQFLYSEQRIGNKKVTSAQHGLCSVNSDVTVEPIFQEVNDSNVYDVVGDSEVILDCLDNFPARRSLNLYSVEKGIPLIHGAIWGMEGRLVFLQPPKTPCLTCIFPRTSAEETTQPVLGAVSCTIGSLQALEAIKYLIKQGRLLSGRMLVVDGATMQFQEFEVHKDPACPVCGPKGI